MIGFVRAFDFDADVVGLFLREFREADTEFCKVKTRNFLVKMLREDVNAEFIVILPEIHLCQDLIREGVAHYEARMSRCVAEVY